MHPLPETSSSIDDRHTYFETRPNGPAHRYGRESVREMVVNAMPP